MAPVGCASFGGALTVEKAGRTGVSRQGQGGAVGGFRSVGAFGGGGDDRAGKAVRASPLTEDHRASAPRERARVEAEGGRVFGVMYDDGSTGPDRLWLPTLDVPGLATARSLGDTIGAEFAGVSAAPFLRQIALEGDVDHPSLQDVGAVVRGCPCCGVCGGGGCGGGGGYGGSGGGGGGGSGSGGGG